MMEMLSFIGIHVHLEVSFYASPNYADWTGMPVNDGG